MRKISLKLFYLIVCSLGAGLGIGATKFFLLGYLAAEVYSTEDKVWVIQLVGALITVGPGLVYVLSSPLASSYYKRHIMAYAALVLAGLLLFGSLSTWLGSAWIYALGAGLLMGILNPARNAAVPLEAKASGHSTEYVNAWLNNFYILGLLAGVPVGTAGYLLMPHSGAAVIAAVFALTAVFASKCIYCNEEVGLRPFKIAFTALISDSCLVLKKYADYLIAGSIFWGMAGALTLAITAYAETSGVGSAVQCSFMAGYAALGVAVGNAASPAFAKKRFVVLMVCTLALLFLVLCVPLEVEFGTALGLARRSLYALVSGTAFFQGLFFGLAANLIEARYFSLLFEEHKEGSGAALLSALTAFCAFVLGGIVGLSIIYGWLSAWSQFVFLSLSNLIALICVIRLYRKAS